MSALDGRFAYPRANPSGSEKLLTLRIFCREHYADIGYADQQDVARFICGKCQKGQCFNAMQPFFGGPQVSAGEKGKMKE
jgi:hypothetical protein